MANPLSSIPAFLKGLLENVWQPTPQELGSDLHAKIIVNPRTGETQIEAINGNGVNCKELTEALEKAQGGVTSRTMKPEASRVNRKGSGSRITDGPSRDRDRLQR